MKSFFKKYGGYIGMLLAIALIYGVMLALGITCPIKYITGISCAGCGISRACFSALTLDFARAFEYNPMWVTLPFVAAALAVLKILKKRSAFDIVLTAFAGVMLAVWLYRLIFSVNPEVVGINLSEGLIGRAVIYIKSLIVK